MKYIFHTRQVLIWRNTSLLSWCRTESVLARIWTTGTNCADIVDVLSNNIATEILSIRHRYGYIRSIESYPGAYMHDVKMNEPQFRIAQPRRVLLHHAI
ncbi:hypothetical protein Y032_0559g3447 [Ancylostoma ceylanicum]|uniref:Uncharacterized protein n=1 Tax=Ancylostoma ceylanicum TaxID=53326 RepID=A0A016WPF8_9BILA|nr:hypothetical protein Y032_0559g3447 [Ancylostoma ceylanicum]